MTPWPAIPDLPGHVVEVGRREDGARRRLDLFVHPEGLQPHHVAIRLDLWEGRAPELHAGFGAEARPVCLPEHLDPQEAAVEAAAGIVALMVGDGPAVRLWERWRGARGRLEGRIAELEAEGELAQELRVGARGFLFTTARATRRGHDRDLHGQMLCGGRVVCSHDSSSVPVDAESVVRLSDMSGHEKLDVLASPKKWLRRLRSGFFFEGETENFALPSGERNWIVRSTRPSTTSHWATMNGDAGAFYEDGSKVIVKVLENRIKSQPGYALRIRAIGSDGTTIPFDIGNVKDSGPARRIFELDWARRCEEPTVDGLRRRLRLLVGGLVAIDPDISCIPLGHRNKPPFHVLRTHPVVRGFNIPPGLQGVIGKLLGRPYQLALADAKAFDSQRELTP